MRSPRQHNRGLFHKPLLLPSCVRGPAGPSHSVWEGTPRAVRPQGPPPPAHSMTSEALEARALHPTCSSYAPRPGLGRAGPLGLAVACPLAWGLERSQRPPAQGMVPARACPAHPEHLCSRASLSPAVSLVIAQPVSSPWVTGASSSQPTPSAGEGSMDSRTGLCHTAEKPL